MTSSPISMSPPPPPPPPPQEGPPQPREYMISNAAKEKGIRRIYDRLGSDTKVVVEFDDDVPVTVDFEDEKKCFDIFKRDIKDLGKSSDTMMAALAELHKIMTPKMQALEVIRKEQERLKAEEESAKKLEAEAAAVQNGEVEEEQVKEATVCKYTPNDTLRATDDNDVHLWESVVVQGRAEFVGYDRTKQIAIFKKDITDTWRNLHLRPNRDDSHKLYEFMSKEEVYEYIATARRTTFSQLWDMVHGWVEKCYDTDNEYINTLVTILIIFSYFFDKIGITPYLFLHGEPVTGKNALLKIIELLGYRFAQMSLTRAAGIYRLLGDIEPGQVNMFMDEMSYLDSDPLLLELLKIGYEITAKVPRNFDVTSAELASMKHFFGYCMKVFASEKLPRSYLMGGFKTRTFDVETSYGVPKIDIRAAARSRDDPEFIDIKNKIDSLRKSLFAYRLVHIGDVFPRVETKLQGRHKELAIGSLTLAYGTDKYDLVKRTLYHHISEQMEGKLDSLPVYMATLIKHLGKVVADPNNKDKTDTAILGLFQESYNKEMQKDEEEIALGVTSAVITNDNNGEPIRYFDTVTLESDLIWEAVKRVLPGAEEINYNPNRWNDDNGDGDNENNNNSNNKNNTNGKSNKNKKFKRNTGSGKKVIQSNLFHDLSWNKSLPSVLHQIGGSPTRSARAGKRLWIIDGKRLARFEKSYAQIIRELTSVEKNNKKVDDTCDTSDTSLRYNSNNSDEKSKENIDAAGHNDSNSDNNNSQSSPANSSTEGDSTTKAAFLDDKKGGSPLESCFRCLRCRQHSDITNDNNNSSEDNLNIHAGSGQATIVLPQTEPTQVQSPILEALSKETPRAFAGDGTHDTLFYGYQWVSWDLEWDPSTSKIYAAGFIDYAHNRYVFHLSDPEFKNDEGKLLDKILETITKYPISFAYYSTGMFSEWSGRGKDADLITLHRRFIDNGKPLPIEIFQPEKKGYGWRRPRFKSHLKHLHYDLCSVYDNEVVKNFIEVEEEGKYAYRSSKLEHVAEALTRKGKFAGISGRKIHSQPVDVQKEYVLQDAVLLHDIVLSNFGKKVISLLEEFARALNADLHWICHTSITAWWTKIFDDLGCTRPKGMQKERYDGALVLPCKSGYYNNVTLVDVKSLYPTMAIIHNLGFDTINCECCKHDLLAKVPRWALIDPDGKPIKNKTYWVCRKKVSIYRERLIVFRELKDKADKAGLTMVKQAYKLLMNASYGSFATYGFGYLFTAVSELITGWGRFTLRVMNAVALAMGLQPIAGDTDSLFLANVKSKEQLERYFKRCQELLRVVEDPQSFSSVLPSASKFWDVEIENKTFDKSGKSAPITFRRFWNVVKKHYYSIDTTGKFRSVKLEVEKDNAIEYSSKVLWEQWKADLEAGRDPIVNLQRLTSDHELKTVLKTNPHLLRNSQKVGENPGVIDPITGELVGCTYTKPNDPLPVMAREQGLSENDICYFYKTGENKRSFKVDEDTGKPLGSYTANPKYASINKIRQDLTSAWMKPLKVYLGYRVPPTLKEWDEEKGKTKDKIQKHMTAKELEVLKKDKEVERKIIQEIFGLER